MENYVFSNGFGQAYTYYYNGEGEYRVAMRVCNILMPVYTTTGTGEINYLYSRNITIDYHFWKQNPKTGKWWNKHGGTAIQKLGDVNPDKLKSKGWLCIPKSSGVRFYCNFSGSYYVINNNNYLYYSGLRYKYRGVLYKVIRGPLYYNSKTMYLAFKGTFWSQ